MSDWVCQVGADRDFVIFNEDGLGDDPIEDHDLVPVTVPQSLYQSLTWSCGIRWYFVVVHDGIVLVSVDSPVGMLCRKKSYRFIEAFLDHSPKRKSRHPEG